MIREAGDSALLVELDAVIDPRVNAHAIAIAEAVRGESMSGVRDVVSTFRSVAVYFDPLAADVDAVRAALERALARPGTPREGRRVEVPVVYGGEWGPDIDEVARFAGISAGQVVDRHVAADYRVYMLGFQPGFAYLGTVAPDIAIPRKTVPRLHVPGGSVGIAGPQTAVYPRDSPGGWNIIGRTAFQMFDTSRTPAALLAPGDMVRFLPTSSAEAALRGPEGVRLKPNPMYGDLSVASPRPGGRRVTILRPGLFTTVQDSGRWGEQGMGRPVGGAMDLLSHRVANIAVGNAAGAATLEATLVGPELRVEQDATMAIAGADLEATLDGAAVPLNTATRCRPGAVVRFGGRRTGARAYVAFDGGIAMADGAERPATIKAGDCLSLALPGSTPPTSRMDVPARMPTGGGARLRVMRGPQDQFFSADAFDLLQRIRFIVSSHSNRMGYRLQGGRIPRADDRDMISDATFAGGIQVPASGEPILLMADRQTTGGYPQMATVITADLPLAGQLAPGDWIEFELCSRATALQLLADQEGGMRAFG